MKLLGFVSQPNLLPGCICSKAAPVTNWTRFCLKNGAEEGSGKKAKELQLFQ